MKNSLKTFFRFSKRVMQHGLRRAMQRGGTEMSEAFCQHCEKTWKPRLHVKSKNTILVGLFNWNPSICSYVYASHYLARESNSRLSGYYFGDSGNLDRMLPIYRSFGVNLELSGSILTHVQEKKARILAKEAFKKLSHRDDIFKIMHGDVVLGDIIYDTFLRYNLEPTVNHDDNRLFVIIHEAFRISIAASSFFSQNQVSAVLPYDPVYIESGIVQRHAILNDIPCYVVEYNPFRIHKCNSVFMGEKTDYKNWPVKDPLNVYPKSEFWKMGKRERVNAIESARNYLNKRLDGHMDPSLVIGRTAFGPINNTRIFPDNNVPRIIIFLHDFCDAPNYMRWNLFPDFYCWLKFILNEALDTPFQWYVKPHPNIHPDNKKGSVNHKIVEKFRKEYPKIIFLDAATSNNQIIKEGVSALFTVRGTAGHEFAYRGIPVVNAGDNPHIEYNFNFNPNSVEELRDLIHRANRLKININKTEVEIFCYLKYLHDNIVNYSGVNMIPEEQLTNPNLSKWESGAEIFRHFVKNDTINRRQLIKNYVLNQVTNVNYA